MPHITRCIGLVLALESAAGLAMAAPQVDARPPLRTGLTALPFKIAYESYVNDNWEIFVMNADGAEPANLTNTPQEHEHYPQVSPDGTKMCFVVDQGEGRDTVRSLWVMDIDGRNRKKLADYAREPFWTCDGKTLGYLPQEYHKFNVIDYSTSGMNFYELATGSVTSHSRGTNLHHLYNPCLAANGQWVLATVNAGMGLEHAIVLIAMRGEKVINLQIPGCRAWLSPDGKQIAWGAGEYEVAVAPINLDAATPAVGPRRIRVQDAVNRVIHVDWSPDGRFLCFSRGPAGTGDPTRPGTFSGSRGLVGVYAPGWNLCVVSAERDGILDLNRATAAEMFMVTTNGCSNKEPCWFRPGGKARP